MEHDMNPVIAGFLSDVGLGSPLSRGVFGACIFSIPILLKMGFLYYPIADGIYLPKEFYFTASKDTPIDQTTYIPWWSLPILGAAIFGLFL